MATCTFNNLTPKQAKTLAEWYSEQGEQDAGIWFEINCEDPTPIVDKIEIDIHGDVTVKCD